ncbi:MAG: HutD family protein, partial [Pygmaiobacter sp.]
MNYELRQACDYCTTDWSGGRTTQLYIYPEDGDYATRNFAVRISSATVETEESVFTPLPGVQRELMILEGTMTICHEGGSPKSMKPFCDVDSFSGDRETKSRGKVRDFNLMTQNGACGTLVFVET